MTDREQEAEPREQIRRSRPNRYAQEMPHLTDLATLPPPPPGAILVLACGNDLRGDDALGARFVAAIEEKKRHLPAPWQSAIATHWQLQWWPETALLLAKRQLVVLVDAAIAPDRAGGCTSSGDADSFPPTRERASPLTITRLTPPANDPLALLTSVGTHQVTPQALLAAALLLAVPLPPAIWLLALTGNNFRLGASLSPQGEEALQKALAWFWPAVRAEIGAQERTRTSTPCGAGT